MDLNKISKNSQAKSAQNSVPPSPRLIKHVDYVPIGRHRACRRNAREDSKNQIRNLARGIREFGLLSLRYSIRTGTF